MHGRLMASLVPTEAEKDPKLDSPFAHLRVARLDNVFDPLENGIKHSGFIGAGILI